MLIDGFRNEILVRFFSDAHKRTLMRLWAALNVINAHASIARFVEQWRTCSAVFG